MANAKFKPKTSSNIIEGATPVDEKMEAVASVDTESSNHSEDETPSVEVSAEEVNTSVIDSTPAVKFESKKTSSPIEKNVRVCTNTNHSCNIGGVQYHFIKGKQVNVPESVKAVLMKADLLMPL